MVEEGPDVRAVGVAEEKRPTANLRTKILDIRGFDSSIIFILRAGILMSIGNFPEVLSQRILVGIILVGRLGVRRNEIGTPSVRQVGSP